MGASKSKPSPISDLPFLPDEVGVDVSELRKLREQFQGFDRSGLYHATRVMVRPDREAAEDLANGWEEFLRAPTFQHTAFRLDVPLPRVQHLCFYGDGDHLEQFTGLAERATLALPQQFFPRMSPNPKDWEAGYCRDQWLFGLYRLAYLQRGVIPIRRDLERNGEGPFGHVDRGCFDPLARAGCCDECERTAYEVWRSSFDLTGTTLPRYLYAALGLNVWAASLSAINYLIEHPAKIACDLCFWERRDWLTAFFPELK